MPNQPQQQAVGLQQIATGSIGRSQLNVDFPGQAVIRRLISGKNSTVLISTGVDSGTGDVTIFVSGTINTDFPPTNGDIARFDSDNGWIPDSNRFTNLTDVPSTLIGSGGKLVQVNDGGTALIFNTFQPAYIDGLNISYSTSGTISVRPGAAFIPSLNRLSYVTGTINQNIPIVSTNVSGSWQNVYLYEVAGVPTIQVTGTAPSTPYSGVAKTKTGDTSMRYLGSVYCDTGGYLYRFNSDVWGNIWKTNWLENANAFPFQFANVSGTVTTPTSINLPWIVPPTAGLITEIAVQTVHGLVAGGDNVISISDDVSIVTPGDNSAVQESLSRYSSATASNIQIPALPIKITHRQLKYTHQNIAGTNGGFFRARGYSIQR